MTIIIEFDGSCATCDVVNNGTRKQFAYSDRMTQLQVLESFRCIKNFMEHDILANNNSNK